MLFLSINTKTDLGSFIGPGIDVDKDSNAYITVGDKLLKVSPEGKITLVSDGFSCCFDVKSDSKGNLFVADDTKDTIYRINTSNEKSVFYRGEMAGAFLLTSLVSDKNVVKKIDAVGNTSDIGTLPVSAPVGLAPGGKGFDGDYLYVAVADGIVKLPK